MELDLTDEQVNAIRLLESIGCSIIFNNEIRKDENICIKCGTHLVDGGFGRIICPNIECDD